MSLNSLNDEMRDAVFALNQKFDGYVQKVLDGSIDLFDDYDGAYYALYLLFERDMPYGTAKGRDGDPGEFIFTALDRMYPNGTV